jgi:hypothetical protein
MDCRMGETELVDGMNSEGGEVKARGAVALICNAQGCTSYSGLSWLKLQVEESVGEDGGGKMQGGMRVRAQAAVSCGSFRAVRRLVMIKYTAGVANVTGSGSLAEL